MPPTHPDHLDELTVGYLILSLARRVSDTCDQFFDDPRSQARSTLARSAIELKIAIENQRRSFLPIFNLKVREVDSMKRSALYQLHASYTELASLVDSQSLTTTRQSLRLFAELEEITMIVYSVFHAGLPMVSIPYVQPIHAGAIGQSAVEGVCRDDTGDHISHKNKHYAELSALYWIWKNAKADILGICHYRRFFCPLSAPTPRPVIYTPPVLAEAILSMDAGGKGFKAELLSADIIVPMQIRFYRPLKDQYLSGKGKPEDWSAAMAALEHKEPRRFKAAERFFEQSNVFHGFNMFIARKNVLSEYCDWLFSVLSEVESRIEPSNDPEHCRVFGILGEWLFTWWLKSRNLRVIEHPVLMCGTVAMQFRPLGKEPYLLSKKSSS
jgi:hypothetical protein